ncbi:MAG: NRAMP family divalent metal transporter [Terriglobales bacterium]
MDSQRSRKGTAADRGKLLRWPASGPAPQSGPPRKGWTRTLRRLGPGFVTGAADVDPSLVIAATVAGAAYGYSLLWVVLLCIPFLITVFAVTGRIGWETRAGLVELLRHRLGRGIALGCAAIIVVINLAMITADLMAVSAGFSIILNMPRTYFVAAAAFSIWYILIFRDYHRVTRALIWLSLPLFVYVAAAVIAAPSPAAVLHGTFVPHVPRTAGYASAVVGLMGALLTPYVLVWQTSSRREQAESGGEEPHGAEGHAGTFVTTLLAYCAIVAAGSVLHIPDAVGMTIEQAAQALKPAAGAYGAALFAVGIIGAGGVALPVLVSSMCYSVAEAMGWEAGLSRHPWEAKSFYLLISLAMLTATMLNFTNISPVAALYWSQVLAGLLTVPILIFILILANDRRIVQTPNTKGQNFWIGGAAGALTSAAALLVWWKLHP